MNNGSGWVSSNSCTLTELLFTNSNHNIKFIPTTLSRDGAVYTLPSQIGNNVDVLTVSGSTTSIKALCWSSISLDKFSDTGISNPVSGKILSFNGNVWFNSNTCALTQLNCTNTLIMKLEVYKSVYMFDTNGCGFTHVSFYLPTMTNGTKLERWN